MPLWVPYPRGRISTDTLTANSATFTTTALTLITRALVVPNGRRYRLTFNSGLGCASTVANDVFQFQINSGATSIAQSRGNCGPVINTSNMGATATGEVIGAGASISFTVTVLRGVGTGTLTHFASVVAPANFYIDDMGT